MMIRPILRASSVACVAVALALGCSSSTSPFDGSAGDVVTATDAGTDASAPTDAPAATDTPQGTDAVVPDAGTPTDVPVTRDVPAASDAGAGCTTNADCTGAGMRCGFLIAEACSAVGTCVMMPVASPCGAIELLTGCGCTGAAVMWTGGCAPQYPAGYAPAAITHMGACP